MGDVPHLGKVVSKEVEIKIDVIFRRHPVALRAGIPDSFGPVGSPKMGILTTSPCAEPVSCTYSHAIFINELRRVSDGTVFRVTSNVKDSETPDVSTFQIGQVTAERWELT